ncbi:type IV pilus twitching motility protein PilT [Shimwellia blattae]|uniref:Pilus retraction protein-like protein n=1 Tax=Shimwellia blattae (strain ATCC 29907 / DSM 4481 / JCM 1650 / NBRC 105725 / CDC 9005-74) TaxID=630626 RepID=I2B590_SHIBC|nr:PilT/PilU family type 4a pilus ATPase [Shimwellia blattae]AFJ45694.1 pilus retraction protein-like protein [Shimwellia blattae DSM 4481 = NBRC 105725]
MPEMEELVAHSVKHYVSDLHLCTGFGCWWRRAGILEAAPLVFPEPAALLAGWLTPQQQLRFERDRQLDFAVTLACGQRLRANAFRQRLGVSLALRILPRHCPSLATLAPPAALEGALSRHSGILLVTGATGSGKSTSLAAMVGWLAQQGRHIVCLEDPLEYLHPPGNGLVQQREIGEHCLSFSDGLRAALREDPDVILLGELRDAETIRLALTAAETGHLVLGTLHTRGACQAVSRLVDVFPDAGKDVVRAQLAESLCAVLAQRLVAARAGGRVALFELLLNTTAVANLIREGKTHQLPGILQTGRGVGMQNFAHSLAERQAAGELA